MAVTSVSVAAACVFASLPQGGGRGAGGVEDAAACVFCGHRCEAAQAAAWGLAWEGGVCLLVRASRRDHAGCDQHRLTGVEFNDWVCEGNHQCTVFQCILRREKEIK